MRHLLIIAALAGCSGGGKKSDVCSLDMAMPATGALPAWKAQLCNVPGSMGALHWYKLSAALPEQMDYVQLELWDHAGAFAGTAVHTGTFDVDPDPATCGVCVRAIGDKGLPTEKEYFATSGSVTVTALGADTQPISATLSNLTFVEVDAKVLVTDGCVADLAATQMDGTVVKTGGAGGGGGGGGNTGSGGCLLTVGD
jgi:hypothetical protein